MMMMMMMMMMMIIIIIIIIIIVISRAATRSAAPVRGGPLTGVPWRPKNSLGRPLRRAAPGGPRDETALGRTRLAVPPETGGVPEKGVRSQGESLVRSQGESLF